MSDDRECVMSAVHNALADVRGTHRSLPEIATFAVLDQSFVDLAAQFERELAAVAGSCALVSDGIACGAAVARYLRERGVRSVAVQSSPLARTIALGLDEFDISSAATLDKIDLERCDGSLLEARALLADTGSAIVLLDNTSDRMLPYLPRTCAVVAKVTSLHAALGAEALACVAEAAAAGARGEALLVTGPSRTADIEKTLVLGAHGPEALAVFIMEQS